MGTCFGINTFSIVSIIDVNNEAAPNILTIFRLFTIQPVGHLQLTPVIYKDRILEFDFLAEQSFYRILLMELLSSFIKL